MKPAHWVMLGALAVIAATVAWPMFAGGGSGFAQPQAQPVPDTDLNRIMDYQLDGHPGVACQPHQHHSGYTYTRHRYPRTVGGEITALIHKGYSPMRVPNVTDVQWIIAPPSEVMW
jgi:hypothetical protein